MLVVSLDANTLVSNACQPVFVAFDSAVCGMHEENATVLEGSFWWTRSDHSDLSARPDCAAEDFITQGSKPASCLCGLSEVLISGLRVSAGVVPFLARPSWGLVKGPKDNLWRNPKRSTAALVRAHVAS